MNTIANLFLACAIALGAAGGEEPLFADDFSAGLERWVMTDSAAWKILDDGDEKRLSLHGKSDYAPPVRSPHNMARVRDLVVTDFTLDVDAQQTGREYGHRDLCFFFGYQDPSKFYYVHLATVADPHANSIFIVNDAPRVSVAAKRTDGTDWKSGFHHIRIERNTETGGIKVYFNDMENPVMEAVDKTFLHGEVGVGSFDDTGDFDNFTVHGVLHKAEE